VLERQLDAADLPYVLVTHIVRSFENRHDGKILVLRGDSPPEICRADKVDLSKAARIIYKPLGSPLLHDRLDENLGLDTVVVTELDHLTFLGRLEHQGTQVPTNFCRLFQTRSLLFLGYSLDYWHYRLVMHVFQSIGGRKREASTIAVRCPVTKMEKIAWKRLGADLIFMEPGEFANQLASHGASG